MLLPIKFASFSNPGRFCDLLKKSSAPSDTVTDSEPTLTMRPMLTRHPLEIFRNSSALSFSATALMVPRSLSTRPSERW